MAGNVSIFPLPSATRMPRIAHFIFGLRPDFGGKAFSLVHYLAIRSAHDRLGPKWKIFVRAHSTQTSRSLMLHLMQVFFSHEPKSAVSSRLWRELLLLPRLHMYQVCEMQIAHVLFCVFGHSCSQKPTFRCLCRSTLTAMDWPFAKWPTMLTCCACV